MSKEAPIIIKQLGGYWKLKSMINIRNIFYSDEKQNVSFKFSGNPDINYCKIHLNGKDLYNLEFGKVKKLSYEIVNSHYDIYNDMLKNVFEQETSLYLSL